MKKLLLIGLLTAMLLLVACTPTQNNVAKESLPDKPQQAEAEKSVTSGAADLVGEVACAKDRLTLEITNTGDRVWNIGQDVKFLVNTAYDDTPECSPISIAPGATANCELDVVSPGLKPSLIIESPEGKEALQVTC